MPESNHEITVQRVASRCGSAGHTDTVVKCSCGKFEQRLNHGEGDTGVLGHRIEVIERQLGYRVTVKGLPDAC